MNLHFPLPKIRTIRSEFTLSLAKNSHFSFLPSHFPSLPSRRGQHCGAESRNEFTLSIAKKCFALFLPPLSNGTSRATSERKAKTNDQILPSAILFFPTKKWIKLIPKTIGNRKEIVREVARGDKPYLRKSTDRKAQIRKAFVQRTDLCFAIGRFSQVRFITPSHLTHNLFSISNSFRYYLILFLSRIIYRFAMENGPKLTCGRVFFNITLFQKRI